MAEKEYIEREVAEELLSQPIIMSMCLTREECLAKRSQRDIDVALLCSIPAADVRPVVRGRWIRPTRVPDSMLDECSVCGFDTGAYTFNFCPNCGATMEEH